MHSIHRDTSFVETIQLEDINQVILAGLVAVEPVGRVMGNGEAEYVAALACKDQWTDSVTGQPRERTDWLRIVIYGRLGDRASEVMKKGVAVRVHGRLRTRDSNNNHYAERKATFVEVIQFSLLDRESVTESRQFESEFGPLRSGLDPQLRTN